MSSQDPSQACPNQSTTRSNQPPIPNFSDLPTELRLAIWELVDYGPRIIRIGIECVVIGKTTYDDHGRPDSKKSLKLKRASDVPAMLHVNHEARDVALKTYTRALTYRLGGKYIYIDWTRDALYMPHPRVFEAFLSSRGGPMTPDIRDDVWESMDKLTQLIIGNYHVYAGNALLQGWHKLKILTLGWEDGILASEQAELMHRWNFMAEMVWEGEDVLLSECPMIWCLTAPEIKLLTGYEDTMALSDWEAGIRELLFQG